MKIKTVSVREIKTDRLFLRRLKASDAEAIFYGWANDPEVAKYVTWSPHSDVSVTKNVLSQWISEYNRPKCIRYGIELSQSGELIGMIDVVGYYEGNPVVGYCLSRKYWNCGYMTEAFGAVLEMLFENGFKTVFIEAIKENTASIRVIEKCGFVFLWDREFLLSPDKAELVTISAFRLDKRRYKKLNSKQTAFMSAVIKLKNLLKG